MRDQWAWPTGDSGRTLPLLLRTQCCRATQSGYIKMASFSAQDDDLLVDLISENPTLYDTTIQSYKDTVARENIWEEIGNTLQKTSVDCKKRWKYIRDSFNRCKRKNTFSSKTSKWMLYEKLRFLDQLPSERKTASYFQPKREQPRLESDDEGNGDVREIRGKELRNEGGTSVVGTSSEKSSAEESSNEETSGIVTTGRKRSQESDLQRSLLQYWKERDRKRPKRIKAVTGHQADADVDGIHSFCTHIGSILTKLPPVLRVEAKTKLFNVLAEYELKSLNVDASSTSFSPHPISMVAYSTISNTDPLSPS